VDATVAHVHAIDDGIPKRPAALDDPPTHGRYIVVRSRACQRGTQLARFLLSCRRPAGFLLGPLAPCCTRLRFPSRASSTLCVHTSAQRVHQIDDFGWFALFWRFDLLAGLLPSQKFL
jgi:hypothetical protein